MFNPELEVPDLDLCRQLKQLHYPQEDGGWYWCIDTEISNKPFLVFVQGSFMPMYMAFYPKGYVYCLEPNYLNNYIKAPTNAELGNYLILQNEAYYTVYSKQGYFCKSIDMNGLEDEYMWTLDKKEANARAKMLIWLAKNKCVKFL